MVFQTHALYPHMTVAENIGVGLRHLEVEPAGHFGRVAICGQRG
jgi:ABC-type sugar transport system ATPase subunit